MWRLGGVVQATRQWIGAALVGTRRRKGPSDRRVELPSYEDQAVGDDRGAWGPSVSALGQTGGLRAVGGLGVFPARGFLPACTGPCSILAGRRVLVLCDDENLRYGARDRGYKVSYFRLGQLLREHCERCELHTFFSCERDGAERAAYFARRGWVPHVHPIETVQTGRGIQRLANSDNLILLWAGWLAARSEADLIVVASGDGTLVTDIARFLAGEASETAGREAEGVWPVRPGEVLPWAGRAVATLSLGGSTSTRLDAAQNPYISANLAIGLDVLRPLRPGRP